MRRAHVTALGMACAVALATAGCAKSSSSGDGGDLKVGFLMSLSGPASAGYKNARRGVDARLADYKKHGGKCADTSIDLVTADDASTPQGALAASQKLISQEKVDAILEISTFFYGAAPYVTGAGKNVPVFGGATDGAEQWEDTDNNIFPVFPVPNLQHAYPINGQYLKSAGATRVAALSYNTPSSKANLKNNLTSIKAAGLEHAYVNDSIPFGSPDVGALVLGIMRSKADAVIMGLAPDTVFAVVTALRQAGYPMKAVVSPTGYGSDLLESAPAVQAAQGVTFSVPWTPVELATPAATRMATAFKGQGSPSGVPGLNETLAWLTTDLFLYALEKAGCDAPQAEIIEKLRADKAWDADGLYPDPFDFSTPLDNHHCLYFVRLKGKAFVPEPNATPICGQLVS